MIRGWGLLLGVLAGMSIAFGILTSCQQTPAQDALTVQVQADVAAYAAEEQGCVAGSATRARADACIAGVKARWCGPGGQLQQAGACGDAGPEASMAIPPVLANLLGAGASLEAGQASAAAVLDAVAPTDAGWQ